MNEELQKQLIEVMVRGARKFNKASEEFVAEEEEPATAIRRLSRELLDSVSETTLTARVTQMIAEQEDAITKLEKKIDDLEERVWEADMGDDL